MIRHAARSQAWLFLASLLLPAIIGASSGRAQDAPIFRGKTVTIFNWSAPGGGYDASARVLARTIPKYLPGNPTVIVKSLEGAGGFTLMNYLLHHAPKDGSEIAIVPNSMPLAPLLTGTPVPYDAMTLGWLGSLDTYVPILLSWGATQFRSIEDVRRAPMTIGATAAKDAMNNYAIGMNELIGTKIKIINGYSGTGAITLAMERGEVDGLAGWCWTCLKALRPAWVAEKKARVLLQVAAETDPELDAQGIPSAVGLAKTEADKELMRMIVFTATLARPFTAPPGLAPDRLALLRRAFDQSAKDPEMLAEGLRTNIEIHYTDAERMVAMIAAAYRVDAGQVERVRAILAQ